MLLKNMKSRGYEVVLASGKSVWLAPHSTEIVSEAESKSDHISQHEAAGRLMLLPNPAVAPVVPPLTTETPTGGKKTSGGGHKNEGNG